MQWMADTEWSVGLHESRYAYSVVESIHVWTLCVFVGFAVLLDLRLLGITLKRVPVSQITTRLLPWTKVAFVVMVISGLLLFYAIPLRTYHNVFFRAKAIFLLLAGLNAWLFHSGPTYRRLAEWDASPLTPRAARLAGAFSLALWVAIVFSGRMIAYNWFDCESPQKSAFMDTLAGCDRTTEVSGGVSQLLYSYPRQLFDHDFAGRDIGAAGTDLAKDRPPDAASVLPGH